MTTPSSTGEATSQPRPLSYHPPRQPPSQFTHKLVNIIK